MRKEIPKIAAIFLITVGVVVWGLNFIFFGKAPKSKAAGETVSFVFDPVSVSQASGDFVTSVKIKPSIDMYIRGYQFEINFDKSKIQFKDIQYKSPGIVSAGIGDDNSKASIINQNGKIKVVGEVQSVAGQLISANANTEIVTVTFTANSAQSSLITTGATDAKFFMIKTDYSLFEVPSTGPASFSINGSITPTITPGGPTLTSTPVTYQLTKSESGTVTFPVSPPNGGYAIYAILKTSSGTVIASQQDFNYQWTIDNPTIASISPFTGCTNGIQPPCPKDHLGMAGLTPGSATVRLTVQQTSTQTNVASTTFPILVTAAGGEGNVKINLKLKFQGITKKPASGRNEIGVTVTVVKGNNNQKKSNVIFVAGDDGLWKQSTPMVFDKITPGSGYHILVKGGKHLRKKICLGNPSETYPGTYHCDQGKITLKAGANEFDFSGIYLLVGDLPEQDGIVNSYDTSLVYNNLGKKDTESIRLADVNLDGIVDTQDFSLIIAALSIRSDEGDDYNETVPVNPSATIGPTNPGATSTPGPTNPGATSTPGPTIPGSGATGDLLRNGSTYPVYTSVYFINCAGVTSPVNSILLSLLGQSQTHNNTSLTYRTTNPLLIGNINVNDFLAQDLHSGDTTASFSTTASIGVQATGMSNYSSNLSNAYFGLEWCTSTEGCFGKTGNLEGKKYIYIKDLNVCSQ